MKRVFLFLAALVAAWIVVDSPSLAQGRGGRGGGGGGGGIGRSFGGGGGGAGIRMGGGGGRSLGGFNLGGGGGRSLGGMNLGGGGRSLGALNFGGGRSMAPAIRSGANFGNGGGGTRLPSNLGNLGSIPRMNGSPSVRSGPSLNLPNLNTFPRQGTTNLGPAGTGAPSPRIQSGAGDLRSRLSQGLNNAQPGNANSSSTLGNALRGLSGGRLQDMLNSNPNLSGLGRLLQNRGQSGGSNPASRIIDGAGAARGDSLAASLRSSLSGRTSAGDLSQFLGVNRRPAGLDVGSLRGNLSRAGAAGDLAAGRGLGRLNLSDSQVNLIRNNVNTAFRNQLNVSNRINNFNNININNFQRFNNNYFLNNPNRALYWNNWCGGIANYCNFNRFYGCFTPRFWATNYCYFPWRSCYYWWGARPWSYWWGCPTWSTFCSFFPNYGWSTPYYYDYGIGGNVVYNNGYVYVNGSQVATAADYAASAAQLAQQPVPANPDQPTDWLPLGTFALSTSETDKDPTRVVQLAVDKDGNISGTMVNKTTNQTYPVQGRVDKETQRVAFTIAGSQDVVLETGLYNLTQQQTPLLAHGGGREETYLLYRLEAPKSDGAAPAAPAANPPLLP